MSKRQNKRKSAFYAAKRMSKRVDIFKKLYQVLLIEAIIRKGVKSFPSGGVITEPHTILKGFDNTAVHMRDIVPVSHTILKGFDSK